MTSQRDSFERVFPIPYNTMWNGHCYVTRSDLADDEPAITHQIRWEGWQAAMNQGGEPVGCLNVEHFKDDPAMQNVEYEHHDVTMTPGRHYLYIHPPKPAGGGVPEAYVHAAEKYITEACVNAVDKLNKLAPEMGFDPGEKTAEMYIRRLRALLATQQPPDQEVKCLI